MEEANLDGDQLAIVQGLIEARAAGRAILTQVRVATALMVAGADADEIIGGFRRARAALARARTAINKATAAARRRADLSRKISIPGG